MILCYPQDPRSNSKSIWVMDALAKAHENSMPVRGPGEWNDVTAVWGLGDYQYALVKKFINKKNPFIFTDMPYWNRWLGNNRHECYWRIIPNALHCNWQADYPDDRFRKLGIEVQEWNDNGKHILVCPSSPTLSNFYDQEKWLDKTLKKLESVTDRPIRIRHKPRRGKLSGPMVEEISLREDCRNAWAVVTLCSIAGVEAACLGIPVFCHESSPCAPIGNTDLDDIENPLRPERNSWLNTLAYHQYTEDEINRGLHKEILVW